MAGALNGPRRNGSRKTVADLRHRVTIQKRPDVPTRETGGAEVEAWETLATVFASVEPVGGKEMMRNGQVQANTTYRVVLRHRGDVTPDMRLVWLTSVPKNKLLNVTAAPPTVGAGNSLELVCVEEA